MIFYENKNSYETEIENLKFKENGICANSERTNKLINEAINQLKKFDEKKIILEKKNIYLKIAKLYLTIYIQIQNLEEIF